MFRKVLAQVLVLIILLLALLGIPLGAQAGGVCGGTYVVDAGDTVDSIAAMCGTSASAIYAANPGVSGTLYAGQVLILPGSSAPVPSTPIPSTPIPTSAPSGTYYVVQPGDTFSGIASRYGLSVQQLWAANPQIWNINYIYPGQVIYIPAGGQTVYPPTAEPVPLSYGTVPAGTKYGHVRLVDSTSSDIYVSLQGTTKDGVKVIREYPVSGSMTVKVPAGYYIYVAWVGGVKHSGQFNLGSGGDHTITFYDNKVTDG
jgi:LysM repeat protein